MTCLGMVRVDGRRLCWSCRGKCRKWYGILLGIVVCIYCAFGEGIDRI